jgi:hypothetical protein
MCEIFEHLDFLGHQVKEANQISFSANHPLESLSCPCTPPFEVIPRFRRSDSHREIQTFRFPSAGNLQFGVVNLIRWPSPVTCLNAGIRNVVLSLNGPLSLTIERLPRGLDSGRGLDTKFSTLLNSKPDSKYTPTHYDIEYVFVNFFNLPDRHQKITPCA